MAIYAVGDLQGCLDELRRLLDLVHFDPARDRLWCVGDMVNRGSQSLETLRFLRSLGDAFTGVLGNHDLHFLALACGAFTEGNSRFLRQLLDAPDCTELFQWVRSLPLAHREKVDTCNGMTTFLMIHAGIAPGWKFKQTIKLAAEVESALKGPGYKDFLRSMYGNKPDQWQEDLTGNKRLRVITNVLTRIRFCTPEGKMDFAVKSEAETAPTGYVPWFTLQPPRKHKVLLFGHWAMLNGRTNRHDILGLDTGCVWGRAMTLLRLDTGELHQVSCSNLKAN
jgi:bis(5'-nucleosyl)-tetraphosphatase (symmetrical)